MGYRKLKKWIYRCSSYTFNSLYGILEKQFKVSVRKEINFQFPLWDTGSWNKVCKFKKDSFNSLYGIHLSCVLSGYSIIIAFNSLYGILSFILSIGASLNSFFQFPLWDTEVFSDLIKSVLPTFNSLYGILYSNGGG